MKTNRRSAFKKFALGLGGLLGFGVAKAAASESSEKVVTGEIYQDGQVPLFSGSVKHGGLAYIAGKGAHFEGDLTAHTEPVLDEVEKQLTHAGSSMDKVLKVHGYLPDLNDYKAMTAAYRGRFGKNPPLRPTVALFGGVPGASPVEIDCIAA